MSRELYFLRSSEQKIVLDMFKYAHPDKEEQLSKYTEFYGFTRKDLGLYALVNGEIAGAVWARKFEGDTGATMSFAVVPKYEGQGLDSFMMEQFLQEAASIWEELFMDISAKENARDFYEEFGFTPTQKEYLLKKVLEKKEIIRPTDGYNSSKWMD